MDIKLILVAENRIYREGIGRFLKQVQGFGLLSTFSCCSAAKQSIASCNTDIALVDCHVPNSLDTLLELKLIQSDLKVVMLTYGEDNHMLSSCFQSGAEGVVTNSDSMQDLKQCILSVYSGHICYPANSHSFLHPSVAKTQSVFPIDLTPESRLTFRQMKVMRLVEQGHSNKEIARILNIELCTVKNHVHHILDKLRVKNRCEAASVFRKSAG